MQLSSAGKINKPISWGSNPPSQSCRLWLLPCPASIINFYDLHYVSSIIGIFDYHMKSSSSSSYTFAGSSSFFAGPFLSYSSTCFEFTKTAPPKISSSTCFYYIFSSMWPCLGFFLPFPLGISSFFSLFIIFNLPFTPSIFFHSNWL